MNSEHDLMSLKIPTWEEKNHRWLWNPLQKKWVRLFPEEEVRIRMLYYLLGIGYSPARIRTELPLAIGQKKGRADIVTFTRDGIPYLIVECKAPTRNLTLPSYEQITRYTFSLRPTYYALTNGIHTYVYHLPSQQFVDRFPPPEA